MLRHPLIVLGGVLLAGAAVATRPAAIPEPPLPASAGVELRRSEKVEGADQVAGVHADHAKAGQLEVALSDESGQQLRLSEPVPADIMNALYYLKGKYRDLSKLAFTLDISQHDVDTTRDWLSRNHQPPSHLLKMETTSRAKIHYLRVNNTARFLGAPYGDTVVGKIALDADLALKHLSVGLDPVTFDPFEGTPEYQAAVNRAAEAKAYMVRLWLYLKSAKVEMEKDQAKISVEVGIQT